MKTKHEIKIVGDKIRLSRECGNCSGDGFITGPKKCETCDGKGFLLTENGLALLGLVNDFYCLIK